MKNKEMLSRHVYSFGVEGQNSRGMICFDPNGDIVGYRCDRTSKYTFDGRRLVLNSIGNSEKVVFDCISGSFEFKRVGGARYSLEHVFGLDAPEYSTRPKVLVNTIPKAGTYLLAEALSMAGYKPLRLHLADTFLHDNRGIADSEIHWHADTRRVDIPAEVVATIMSNGEFVVGHIGDVARLDRIAERGVQVINAVRDPRTQLVSMFNFNLRKVRPNQRSNLWRTMPKEAQFKGFLLESDVRATVRHNEILTSAGPFFCFEHFRAGRFIEINRRRSNSVDRQQVLADIAGSLVGAIGRPTSTFSKKSDQPQLDDPAIVEFFSGPCGVATFSDYYKKFLEIGNV